MKGSRLKRYRRAFQIAVAIAFIIIPVLNRSRYSYVYGNFLSFHLFGIPLADPLAVLQLSIKNLYLTLDNIIGAALPLMLAFFLGTVFCSWICPYGLLSEWTQGLRKQALGRPGDSALLDRRGFPLKMTIFVLGFTGFFIFSTTPVLNQLSMPAWYARFFQYYFGQDFISLCFLFILAVLAVEFFTGRRLWCRYVCPQSILITLVKQLNPRRLRVAFDPEKCICRPGYERCEAACSLHLHPKTLYEAAELECSNCGDCVVACSRMGKALAFTHVGMPGVAGSWSWKRLLPRPKTAVIIVLFLLLGGSAILLAYKGYQYWQAHPREQVVANVLLDNRLVVWQGSEAEYFELLPGGKLVCVGGKWPTNGYGGGRWEPLGEQGSFRLLFDPENRQDHLDVKVMETLASQKKVKLETYSGGVLQREKSGESVLSRYEPLKQSHEQSAVSVNATAVLNRFSNGVYTLDLRVQDPRGEIEKILTEGDAITNEVMLTNVKYWLNTPEIIVSEGKEPKLPLTTRMEILFHDGHREKAEFSTSRIVDRGEREFEDPWF